MSQTPPSPNDHATAPSKICPFCAELIAQHAKKCRYCGEFVEKKSSIHKQTAKLVGILGLVTAALSLFYPLREGYFYLQQKQQQRSELSSYKKVARYFESLDSLRYAQQAWAKALQLAPNDIDIQRTLLVLQGKKVLRDIEWTAPMQQPQLAIIEDLILNGYRLLQTDLAPAHRAELLTLVARLLPKDRQWSDDQGATAMFAQAYALQQTNPEVVFRYGLWLVEAKIDPEKGLGLLQKALALAPNDALYAYSLAKVLQDTGDFAAAFRLFRRAIRLQPKQRELQRIRAANFAISALNTLLRKADEKQDIAAGEFYGLDMAERQALIEQVLAQKPNNRVINFIAARFYYANQQYSLAEQAIAKTVSEADLASVPRGYYLKQFALYEQILTVSGSNPERLNIIQQALAEYQTVSGFEEALEKGFEGQHRYKIGLRVEKTNGFEEVDGLLVLKAYSGYPFAKAGVQAGDRLLLFAHRVPRSLNDIFSMLSHFAVGTSLPITIERDEKARELTLLVE